jgi:uridine phosphorylase
VLTSLERTRREEGSPLLRRDDYAAPSVFQPQNMLRESRRQKGLPRGDVPDVCIFDPDADIVRLVRSANRATPCSSWACYHTEMWEWRHRGRRVGIVGGAVGGSFAVLVAEQLMASGCALLISVASAGKISADLELPAYVLIERALRDEGTSHHYLPISPFVDADERLVACAEAAFRSSGHRVVRGTTWTTDAPFRETEAVITERQRQDILTVEMEAASLLAFSKARQFPVLCLAHVTNELGRLEGDFEKGEFNGSSRSLALALAVADAWRDEVPAD